MPHAAPTADLHHAAKPVERPLDGDIVEPPRDRHPFGEARLILDLVDDGEAGIGVVFGDGEPNRVRADVNGRNPLACRRHRWRR